MFFIKLMGVGGVRFAPFPPLFSLFGVYFVKAMYEDTAQSLNYVFWGMKCTIDAVDFAELFT